FRRRIYLSPAIPVWDAYPLYRSVRVVFDGADDRPRSSVRRKGRQFGYVHPPQVDVVARERGVGDRLEYPGHVLGVVLGAYPQNRLRRDVRERIAGDDGLQDSAMQLVLLVGVPRVVGGTGFSARRRNRQGADRAHGFLRKNSSRYFCQLASMSCSASVSAAAFPRGRSQSFATTRPSQSRVSR